MLFRRLDLESRERASLAPYACFSDHAQRAYPEVSDEFRTAFARDRARIIHSKSFRRLKGKTQVFIAHYGDHYRNRLTHTMEVAQISREIARALGANEDLAECVALAHDLGHTPFGHVGEKKLDELLRPFGVRFEHNRQSRRIVTELEKKYPNHPGLNLTLDVLDGLAKHATPYDQVGVVHPHHPSLEAQIVDLADEIAYTNHDIDDGLRAGIITRAELDQLSLWREAIVDVDPTLLPESFHHRAVSALIDRMVRDIEQTTAATLTTHNLDTADKIMHHGTRVVAFSDKLASEEAKLRSFLYERFYFAPSVAARSRAGAAVMEQIFTALMKNPTLVTPEFSERFAVDPVHVVVADFIAGMTDSYAEEFLG